MNIMVPSRSIWRFYIKLASNYIFKFHIPMCALSFLDGLRKIKTRIVHLNLKLYEIRWL